MVQMKSSIINLATIISLTHVSTASLAKVGSDQDGDGVPDAADLCSNTPALAPVWHTGLWLGCAQGQTKDIKPGTLTRAQTITAINSCEDKLIGAFDGRAIYSGSTCESFAGDLESATLQYRGMGASDLHHRLAELTDQHLTDRMNLCLTSVQNVFAIFNAMDSSRCNPGSPFSILANDIRSHTYNSSQSRNIGSPLYAAGVTYVTNGSITTGSDGSVYVSSGDLTSGNGNTYVHSGEISVGSDGITYIRSGNITHGSNGVTCVTSGNITHCN